MLQNFFVRIQVSAFSDTARRIYAKHSLLLLVCSATQKSLIDEHAGLDFFHPARNKKSQPAHLLIYLANKQASRMEVFYAICSFIRAYVFIRDFSVRRCQDYCIHSEKYVPDILLMYMYSQNLTKMATIALQFFSRLRKTFGSFLNIL